LRFTNSSNPRVDEALGALQRFTNSSNPRVDEALGAWQRFTNSSNPRVDEALGTSPRFTNSSNQGVGEALGISGYVLSSQVTNSSNRMVDAALGSSRYDQLFSQERLNLTNSSNQMVDEVLGELPLSNISGLRINSSNQEVDETLGVQILDQVVVELMRVWDTPLPLQLVAVDESEHVSAALSSRFASAFPTDDAATFVAIGTSMESRVEGNLVTQRRERASQGSSRVPPSTSPKNRDRGTGLSLRSERSTTGLVAGTSSLGGASLTRHNTVLTSCDRCH